MNKENLNELALFAGAGMTKQYKSSEYMREKAKAWRLANPDRVAAYRKKTEAKTINKRLLGNMVSLLIGLISNLRHKINLVQLVKNHWSGLINKTLLMLTIAMQQEM